jgi:uncharacterized protein YbcI
MNKEENKMCKKTKGQIEAKISEAIIKFEKDYMGRGPEETKTDIIGDMILVRLKGVLTLAEKQLAKTAEGIEIVKKTRAKLLEGARIILGDIISNTTGCQVKSLHTDISTKTGERIIIFTLNKVLEDKNANQE